MSANAASEEEEEELWEFTPRDDGDDNENNSDSDMEDSKVTNRSAKLREDKPHEYIPVPHGGYAVYFNSHFGSQNRERVSSEFNILFKHIF